MIGGNMAQKTLPRRLSAAYKDDFAYPTVKDRIPVILTKIIDQVYRMKGTVKEEYGDGAVDDVKMVAGRLSKLKNEIQTDKPIIPLEDEWQDVSIWNSALQDEKTAAEGQEPSWFKSSWLYVECYFYRRVQETFQLCTALKGYDPFSAQKYESFELSVTALSGLASFLLRGISDSQNQTSWEQLFKTFFLVSLWGNKCDLSISHGNQNHQKVDPVSSLNHLHNYILVNDMDQMWAHISKLEVNKPGASEIFIVLDNAGFELFTDLCLAEFLLSAKLVSKVILYPKAFPWFVSDVTKQDLHWTLEQMCQSSDDDLKALGKRLQQRFDSGAISYRLHDYWTYPYDYSKLKLVAPELYQELSKADLILFKGDLNYRKLSQDRKWDPSTTFEEALGGFQPAPLCVLRTLKADVVVGLCPGQAERTAAENKDWMISGSYAVIQSSMKRIP